MVGLNLLVVGRMGVDSDLRGVEVGRSGVGLGMVGVEVCRSGVGVGKVGVEVGRSGAGVEVLGRRSDGVGISEVGWPMVDDSPLI